LLGEIIRYNLYNFLKIIVWSHGALF
jgi:hypothetical protein